MVVKLLLLYSKLGTIQHLFFECHYAKALWQAVCYVLGIKPPKSTNNLFNSWCINKGVEVLEIFVIDRSNNSLLGILV
jgi:hypothetical protein